MPKGKRKRRRLQGDDSGFEVVSKDAAEGEESAVLGSAIDALKKQDNVAARERRQRKRGSKLARRAEKRAAAAPASLLARTKEVTSGHRPREGMTPSKAAAELAAVTKFKEEFQRRLSTSLGNKWASALEDWLGSSSLARQGGVILPQSEEALRELEQILTEQWRVERKMARGVADELVELGRALAERANGMSSSDDSVRIREDMPAGKLGLKTVLRCGHVEVKLRPEYWKKLKALHALAGGTERTLASDSFCCVARYTAAIGGLGRAAGGSQAAVPPEVIDCVEGALGPGTRECFASPLNARLPKFCSQFPEVDSPFGSAGSFDDLTVTHGCLFCNPPFHESVALQACDHALGLLAASESSEGSLTVAFVLPERYGKWRPLERLVESPYLRMDIRIPARSHCYREGAAHAKRLQFRPASNDTAFVLLQTSKARRSRPIPDDFEERLRSAFAPRSRSDHT